MPGQSPEVPTRFFHEPKGENHIKALTDLDVNESPFVKNIVLSTDGMYICRPGTENVGSGISSPICGMVIFSSKTSSDYIVRVTTTGVDIWGGSSWSSLLGPTLALDVYSFVEFTVWDEDLLFTDGSTGLYKVNVNDGTYSLVAGAAVGKHITTFGGRVIVSYVIKDADTSVIGVLPTRIEWCVKNNNADWLGLGSGYEDLLSSPGGTVDVQHGVFPANDVEAFVIRSSSIWVMNTTGYFDAPFQFTYRFDTGTDSPYSITRVPPARGEASGVIYSQIMMLSQDDVVVVRPEGITPVGFPIRDQLLGGTLNPRRAIAGFEPRNREYWIHVPPLNDLNTTSVVWRYRIDEKIWTHCEYPFKLNRLAFKDILYQQTMDQLTGTMEDLVGPYDELGLAARQPGALMAGSNGGTYSVIREREGVVGDVNALGSASGIPIEIDTGMILSDSPLNDLMILMLEIHYEARQTIQAIFEYSIDGGTTWENYGLLSMPATQGPRTLAYRNTLHRPRLQIRMRSNDGSTLQLHSLFIKIVKGSAINQ